jgi:hypothetical protein
MGNSMTQQMGEQSVVEWLVSQQKHNSYFFIETIEKAKEMENELKIKFAKVHVKKALEEALDSIPCLGSSTDIATYEEVRDAVLNSYPLEKIK